MEKTNLEDANKRIEYLEHMIDAYMIPIENHVELQEERDNLRKCAANWIEGVDIRRIESVAAAYMFRLGLTSESNYTLGFIDGARWREDFRERNSTKSLENSPHP